MQYHRVEILTLTLISYGIMDSSLRLFEPVSSQVKRRQGFLLEGMFCGSKCVCRNPQLHLYSYSFSVFDLLPYVFLYSGVHVSPIFKLFLLAFCF